MVLGQKEGKDPIKVVMKVLQMMAVEDQRQRKRKVGIINLSRRRKEVEMSTVTAVKLRLVVRPLKMMVVKKERKINAIMNLSPIERIAQEKIVSVFRNLLMVFIVLILRYFLFFNFRFFIIIFDEI